MLFIAIDISILLLFILISGPAQRIPSGPSLWLLLLNARLVCTKCALVHNLIIEDGSDMVCITETWMAWKGVGVGVSS